MHHKYLYRIIIVLLWSVTTWGQDLAYNEKPTSYASAHNLAYEGKYGQARKMALQVLEKDPADVKASALVARTYSWSGDYEKARREFNRLTSGEKNNRDLWILAIKNELYAKNNATALGLTHKALQYIQNDPELMRLREMAHKRLEQTEYPEKSWVDNESTVKRKSNAKASKKKKKEQATTKPSKEKEETPKKEKEESPEKEEKAEKKVLNNRIAVRNSFTVFDRRNDPMVFSTIEFKRQTLAGSLLPRINYSNRNGEHGVQYDIDFYPKFSKRFYAYLNYGYSNASIYPNHKVGGDLYVNLPGAMEFSAGGRYISLDTRDITMITNSIGHYRGNYYFSLRSNLVPRDDQPTQFSGNLLVRKYLRDAFNFFSLNVGMGYSPEIRQLLSGDELLAETLLYIESQRMSFQYQFTSKKSPNIYSASLGVSRQELSFESGSFMWSVSAGLAYQVKF